MSDTANPQAGATGVAQIPPGGLDYDTAASLLESALDREDESTQATRERDENGRFVARDERYQAEDDEAPEEPKAKEAEDEDDDAEEASDEGTDAAEETEETEEAPGYSSVNELAEALDMPLDEFLATIKIPVKVDGKEQMVTLSEARDGIQMQSAFTKKTQELAEQRKALEAERETQRQELSQRLQQTEALSKAMEQTLVADYQKINWDDLRITDPAEFAAKRQEFAERVQSIEWMKQQAGQESAKQQEALQQEQQQQLQKVLEREAEALMGAIPEWTNPDKAKAEKAEIRDYMLGMGFTDQDLSQVYDHRAVALMRKAMLYDKGSKRADVAKKRVSTLPKLVKKGSTQNKKETARRAVDKKFGALKKTGKVDEAAALFFDMDL